MADRQIVSRDKWLEQRLELLALEKEFTRKRDELSARRQQLPWVLIDEDYQFRDTRNSFTLEDLFGNSAQLIVYHFMFGADWQKPCKSCAFWADNFNGIDIHLRQRDIALVAISAAEPEVLERTAARFGWTFRWLSSGGSTFNRDFGVGFGEEERSANRIHYNYVDQDWFMDELPGVSVFIRKSGRIYHTYSAYSRGIDALNGAYQYIDLVPKGRNEESGMSWLRLRDEYQ